MSQTPKPIDINAAEDEISLKELLQKTQEVFKLLLSKWKTIFLAGFIGALLGLAYSFYKKPSYKANFSFVLQDEKSNGISGALSLASQFGLDLGGVGGGGAFAGDNLLELMRSRSMVEQALLSPVIINGKKVSLIEYYIQFNKLRKGWSAKPQLSKISFPLHADPNQFNRTQDSIISQIHKSLVTNSLKVSRIDKKLSVINVEVNSSNEAFAKYFAEALVSTVSAFYIDTRIEKSAKNVAILQHQTDSVRQRLNAAIGGVAIANDANPNLNPVRQVLRVPSQQRQVDVQANTAILTELVKNLELSKLALRRETPLIQVIDRPVFPLEVQKLGKLKGLVLGGFLAGFLTALYILGSRFFKNLLE